MNRNKITVLILIAALVTQLACGPQIDRAIRIAKTVPGILQTLPIPNKQAVIDVANVIINGMETFQQNPTRSNLDNALQAVENALNSKIFNFNPLVLGVFQSVRILLSAIMPSADAMSDANEKIEVKDLPKEKVDDLDAKVKALKESAK